MGVSQLMKLAWCGLAGSRLLSVMNGLAIALGVAVVVAIEAGNESALAAFQDTLDVVTGKANLVVSGEGARFDEKVYATLRMTRGVRHATPIVEAVLVLPDFPNTYLRLSGIDVFSQKPFLHLDSSPEFNQGMGSLAREGAVEWLTDPMGLVVTEQLGRRLNLPPGKQIAVLVDGKRRFLTVREWVRLDVERIRADEHLAWMDIGAAQELLGATGKLDRIDLIVDPSLEQDPEGIQKLVPAPAQVAPPDRRGTQVANMLRAYQLNLTALSLIALMVGAFLLHASMTTMVVRQRRSIGILRAMGLTPGDVRNMVLVQSLWVGMMGVIAGIGLGFVLARGSLSSVSSAVSSLYLLVHIRNVTLDPIIVLGVVLGTLILVLVAAWRPAREASGISPIEAMSAVSPAVQGGQSVRGWMVWSLVAIFLAGMASWLGMKPRWALLGFGGAFAWILSVACATPYCMVILERVIGRFLFGLRGGEPYRVGLRNLTRSLHRSGIAAVLLMVAFSMMTGTSIMIDSFRSTVDYWIRETVRADLYLTSLGNLQFKSGEALPELLLHQVSSLSGVRDVDTYHHLWLPASDAGGDSVDRRIKLAAIDFRIIDKYKHLQFKGRITPPFEGFHRLYVNESFATRFGRKAGEIIPLQTPSGPVDFVIGGIFYDYSTDSGLVLIDQQDYARLWKDSHIYSLALYLDDPSRTSEIQKKIEDEISGDAKLALFSNFELRREVLRVFDQTFAITLSLRVITVWVAAAGLFLVLMTLIAERGREVAMLRATGMTPAQVMSMMLVESGALGLVGWLMGMVGGVGLSWILAFVINRAWFGWTIQWRLDPDLLFVALGMAIPAAILAGLLSGWRAVKEPVVAALRYE